MTWVSIVRYRRVVCDTVRSFSSRSPAGINVKCSLLKADLVKPQTLEGFRAKYMSSMANKGVVFRQVNLINTSMIFIR